MHTNKSKPAGSQKRKASPPNAPARGTSSAPRASPPARAPVQLTARPAAAPALSNFACPAFFSSPKPEALPFPSQNLLIRAHAAVAVAAGV